LLHEKPPGGNNEQLVGGLHVTETDELELPLRPQIPAAPLRVLLAYAISLLFRTGAANMTTTARLILYYELLFWDTIYNYSA
jgi:hypothetical protein